MGVLGFDFVLFFFFPEENYFLALGCLPSVKNLFHFLFSVVSYFII